MISVYYIFLALVPLASQVLAVPSGSSSPASPLYKRSVTCLKVGATATATWTDSSGKTCTYSGVVGSNYGSNAAGGDYSCNGRCGAACTGTSIGDVYTQDCFTHDICSYFENATGGSSDKNCGEAYTAAEDDYLLGYAYGCSQTNPSSAAVAPTTSPTCS